MEEAGGRARDLSGAGGVALDEAAAPPFAAAPTPVYELLVGPQPEPRGISAAASAWLDSVDISPPPAPDEDPDAVGEEWLDGMSPERIRAMLDRLRKGS